MSKIDTKVFESLQEWEPQEFRGLDRALMYSIETPAHRFTSVLAALDDKDLYIEVCGRNYFSAELAASTLQFVRGHRMSLNSQQDLTILPGFRCNGFNFDAVGVLGIAASNFNLADHLLGKVCVVFPMYRCELSGNENAALLDVILHEGLCIVDWKRSPYPKLSMEFRNSDSQSKRFGLGSFSLASRVIEAMVGDDGSCLRLQNYIGSIATVRWLNGAFETEGLGRSTYNHEQLDAEMNRFAFGENVPFAREC